MLYFGKMHLHGQCFVAKGSEIPWNKSSKLYFEHCISLCAGGVSGAHKLLKVFEKDEGTSYESEHADMQKKLGPTIAARMASRTSTWAIGKWQVHRERHTKDLEEAFQLLQQKCAMPEHQLQPVSIRHMRNVLASSKRKTGVGCHLWPLHLWSFLPDEALRGLQIIIRSMLQGKIPLQALLTLISFMEKAGGGERPIGLMAMLFRFAMRLHKGLIGQWDDAFHGHWDEAVRNSFCLRAAILRLERALPRAYIPASTARASKCPIKSR